MIAPGLRLSAALRAARPRMLALLVVLQLLAAALVPVAAWATGLVVAQAGPDPVSATAFALVLFGLALWLGQSVGHALWLLRAHVARAVEGAVRSEVRMLLSSAGTLDVVEPPELRNDVAYVMSTGGARGYEQSIRYRRVGAAGSLVRCGGDPGDVALLVPLSPVFAAALGLLLLARSVLQRTWQQEAATEAEGARGARRTAYWTSLGTGDADAKEVRVLDMGPWVAGDGEPRPRHT